MSQNMYGLANHVYLVLGGFKYTSDANGKIANVLDEHAPALQFQRCMDEDAWLKLQVAHPAPGGGAAIQPESGFSPIKISAFPNAASNMGAGDTVTGLQGGVNVNFAQAQISLVKTATAHVSSAELLNLHTSPVQIIAAPGSGKAILILMAEVNYVYGTTTYANVISPSLSWDPLGDQASIFLGSLFDQTSSKIFVSLGAPAPASSTPPGYYENQGIFLTDSQNWTTGDGTAFIYLAYLVAPTQ